MKAFYPFDLRKIEKEKREPLKKWYDSLTDEDKYFVSLLRSLSYDDGWDCK
jgi:hypothetical protein